MVLLLLLKQYFFYSSFFRAWFFFMPMNLFFRCQYFSVPSHGLFSGVEGEGFGGKGKKSYLHIFEWENVTGPNVQSESFQRSCSLWHIHTLICCNVKSTGPFFCVLGIWRIYIRVYKWRLIIISPLSSIVLWFSSDAYVPIVGSIQGLEANIRLSTLASGYTTQNAAYCEALFSDTFLYTHTHAHKHIQRDVSYMHVYVYISMYKYGHCRFPL